MTEINLPVNTIPPVNMVVNKLNMEELYLLFDDLTIDQLKTLIGDIEQEIELKKYKAERVKKLKEQMNTEKKKFMEELEKEKTKILQKMTKKPQLANTDSEEEEEEYVRQPVKRKPIKRKVSKQSE